ncbi:MAG: CoA transferase [Chloroflexi bacterium]|nr:CoA transferase [Chloroflexota bacterium]
METGSAKGLLSGVKVLELGQGVSGPYCGKVLAQLGAEVIKVEPPEGDPARMMGPFPDDEPHPEKSGLFLALNMNKLGVTLDLHEEGGVEKLRQLAESSDVVIENLPQGYLDGLGLGYEAFKEENPGMVYTSITSFGSWGPYADYRLTDLVLFHMSGQAPGLLGPVEDTESDPPIRAGGHQAEFVVGMAAATATLPALYRRRMTGLGAHVEVSAYEAMVTQLISGLANCAYDRPAPPRDVKQVKEATTGGIVTAVGGVLRCSDGYVAISPREDAQWERWVELMGGPDWASDERFTTREGREANFPELWRLVEGWTTDHSKKDVARWGQERRIPCFPVNTVEDLFDDGHLRHRGFFIEQDHPVAGKLKYPGVPYRLSGADLPLATRPAPLLGEHNASVLEGL